MSAWEGMPKPPGPALLTSSAEALPPPPSACALVGFGSSAEHLEHLYSRRERTVSASRPYIDLERLTTAHEARVFQLYSSFSARKQRKKAATTTTHGGGAGCLRLPGGQFLLWPFLPSTS